MHGRHEIPVLAMKAKLYHLVKVVHALVREIH